MSFLQDKMSDISKKAQAAAALVTEKTKDVAEQVKTSVAISNEQREIEKKYHEIGEWFVAEYEGEMPDSVRAMVEAIHASQAKIAELEADKEADAVVTAEEGDKVCPICGAVSNGKFCSDCGAPMQNSEAETVSASEEA